MSTLIKHALKFEFIISNNHAEYETVIVGMILALETRAFRLKAKGDCQLVANQVFGKYQAKKPQLIKYL